MKEYESPDRPPTKGERREAQAEKKHRFRPDNRRSVRMVALLSARQKPQKGRRR